MTKRTEIKRVEKLVLLNEDVERFYCDRCGTACTDDINVNEDYGLPWVIRYELYGNPDSCVNLRVHRQFCENCAENVEKTIMEAFGLRPNHENTDEPDTFWGSYKPQYKVSRKTAEPRDD